MKKLMDRIKKNNKGFTLVELIVVVAVLAIITIVAAPQYLQYVEKSKVGTDENAIGEIAHIAEIQYVEFRALDKIDEGDSATISVTCGDTISVDDSTEFGASVAEIVGEYETKSETYKGKEFDITVGANGVATWPKQTRE